MATRKRTALVTGASSGIGAAYARRLAAEGYSLVLVARRRERLEHVAAGLNAVVLVADLANRDDLERVATRATADDMAMLVNAAGFGTFLPLASSEPAEQLALVHVALTAPIRLMAAALPGMVERQTGAIINVASIGAFLAAPDNATYCAAKAGLLTATRALAVELQGSGVSVQAICPGFTRTEFHDTPALATTDIHRLVPAYFWGSADDVVSASLAQLGRRTVVIPRLRDRMLVYALRAGLARYPRAAQAAPIPVGGAR